jgi:hypothetical protein
MDEVTVWLTAAYTAGTYFFWIKSTFSQPRRALFSLTIIPLFFVAMLFNLWLTDTFLPELMESISTDQTENARFVAQGIHRGATQKTEGSVALAISAPVALLIAYCWYALFRVWERRKIINIPTDKRSEEMPTKPMSINQVATIEKLGDDQKLDSSEENSVTALSKITKRVNLLGDPNSAETPRPLLTLEEFFEGNNVAGSIGCNLESTPYPSEFYKLLSQIRERKNVKNVRVQITQFDDPDWPFSDTVWIVTSETPDEVETWFPEHLKPDMCLSGWIDGASYEKIEVQPGMRPVACWWD